MLERSGTVYSVGTLQFRYLTLHTWYMETHSQQLDMFNTKLLLEGVAVAYLHATDGQDRSGYVSKLYEHFTKTIENSYPFTMPKYLSDSGKKPEQASTANDDDRLKFLALLNSGEKQSGTMSEIVNRMHTLASRIRKAGADGTDGDA